MPEILTRLAIPLEGRRLELALEKKMPLAWAAPRLLERVLKNLLAAAIRHSPAGAAVLLQAVAAEGQMRVSVTDRGAGIGAEHLPSALASVRRPPAGGLGPSVFRVADDWLTGHLNLRDHATARVRGKAHKYGADAHLALKVIPASKHYLNAGTGAWLTALGGRLVAATGPMSRRDRLAARLLPLALRYTDFKLRHGIGQQPAFTRRVYRAATRLQRSIARSAAHLEGPEPAYRDCPVRGGIGMRDAPVGGHCWMKVHPLDESVPRSSVVGGRAP